MGFRKQEIIRGRKVTYPVRAYALKGQVLISANTDRIEGFSMNVGDTYTPYIGHGDDLGWVMIDPSGNTRKAAVQNSDRVAGKVKFTLSGFDCEPAKTTACQYRVEGGCLYVNIPFLSQAPARFAEAST